MNTPPSESEKNAMAVAKQYLLDNFSHQRITDGYVVTLAQLLLRVYEEGAKQQRIAIVLDISAGRVMHPSFMMPDPPAPSEQHIYVSRQETLPSGDKNNTV